MWHLGQDTIAYSSALLISFYIWLHHYLFLLDSFCAEESLVNFGVLMARVNISRVQLLRGLDHISGSRLLSAFVCLGAILVMIRCNRCTETVYNCRIISGYE